MVVAYSPAMPQETESPLLNNNNRCSHPIGDVADVSPVGFTPICPEQGMKEDHDITFLVGLGDDTWSLTANRERLASANQYFKALLYGPMAKQDIDVIVIDDVDKRAFEHVLRYVSGKQVQFISVTTARATLEAAHRYICPGLVVDTVKYIDQNLSPENVLEVFADLRYFRNSTVLPSSHQNKPSAPPLELFESPYKNDECLETPGKMGEFCNALFFNCLLLIEKFAETILEQERIEELCFEDLELITSRPCLNLKSEMTLFNAIHRWSLSECKRKKKDLTPASRRQVLVQIAYSVRYLLLTEREFRSGPLKAEILKNIDSQLILGYLTADCKVITESVSPQQLQMIKLFQTPRQINDEVPIPLSSRSSTIINQGLKTENEILENERNKKLSKKEAKLLKKKLKAKKTENKNEKENACCSCSCFGDSLLRTFLCLFD